MIGVDCVVQQRRSRFPFVRGVFKRDCRDSRDMRDVRNLGFLPQLTAVNSCRAKQRFFKLPRESHVSFFVGDYFIV